MAIVQRKQLPIVPYSPPIIAAAAAGKYAYDNYGPAVVRFYQDVVKYGLKQVDNAIKSYGNMPRSSSKAVKGIQRQLVATSLSGPVRSPVAGYAISSGSGRKRAKGSRRNKQLPGSNKDTITMKFRAEKSIPNTAASNLVSSSILCCDPTNVASFGKVMVPQLSTMANLYREYRFRSIKVSFVPRVGYTTVGNFAVGVDEDPRSTSAADGNAQISQISRYPFYLLTDIKEPGTFTWVPKSSDAQRWRYTKELDRPVENFAFGNIFYGSNNAVADTTTTLGDLYFDVVVEYRYPF